MTIILASTRSPESARNSRSSSDNAADELPLQPFVSGIRAVIPLTIALLLILLLVLRGRLPPMRFKPKKITDQEAQAAAAEVPPSPRSQQKRTFWSIAWPWAVAFLLGQIGSIVFNYGLSYGLVKQGSGAGAILPALFMHIPVYWPSPRYSHGAGVFLVCVFAFAIGFFATLAEPGMVILADTASKATKGKFGGKAMILAVGVGVGGGALLGILRLIYEFPVIYLLMGGYLLAILLSIKESDTLVAIAWDSAGVTTGAW